MNVEQVEDHFAKLDLKAMAPGGANHFTAADVKANPADVMGKVCNVYQSIKPALVLLSQAFFVPKKWRDALKSYMALMDTVCPGPNL